MISSMVVTVERDDRNRSSLPRVMGEGCPVAHWMTLVARRPGGEACRHLPATCTVTGAAQLGRRETNACTGGAGARGNVLWAALEGDHPYDKGTTHAQAGIAGHVARLRGQERAGWPAASATAAAATRGRQGPDDGAGGGADARYCRPQLRALPPPPQRRSWSLCTATTHAVTENQAHPLDIAAGFWFLSARRGSCAVRARGAGVARARPTHVADPA